MREKKRVDDDWKRRAAEEKAKIASQLDPGAGPAGAQGSSAQGSSVEGASVEGARVAGDSAGDANAPPASAGGVPTDPIFIRLISTLGGQAMMALGLAEDPHTGERFLDLDLARQSIDMLGSLELRSRGNTSAEENQLLTDVLHQLRLSYTQRVQQAKQSALDPSSPTQPGSAGPAA